MMRLPKNRSAVGQPAGYWKCMLGTLLLACVADISASAEDEHLVPDNIAPHAAPRQPLPFSHKTHLSSGLVCQTCHVNPEPGKQMTFPATETCMACHSTLATDKSSIMRLLEFSKSGQTIPWVRVYAITPGVSWSHRTHLDAGNQCETCHGDVRQIEAMSETKAVRAMASCIGCHQAREAATDCVSCHSWPTDQMLGLESKN